jgi:hypothetical protein
MQGKQTHEQQLRIINKEVNTKNGADDFDPSTDLHRAEAKRDPQQGGENLRSDVVDVADPDDRSMIRGLNQASEHNKRSGIPD